MPAKVTAPVAALYVPVAPAGSPLTVTPLSPGGKPSVNVVLAAVDGPALLNVALPLTLEPATAVGGALAVTPTSATGEIADVPVDVSGSAFAPWLVVVWIELVALTAPDGGAVKLTPIVMPEPAPRLVGMPVKLTAPVAGS